MDVRVGLVVLLVLAGNWRSDARNLVGLDLSGTENPSGNINVCTLCEEYAGAALDYLNDENNQNEVLETLHNACSQMLHLANQCTKLVDSYASVFFSEVSSVKPKDLCNTVRLCSNARMSSMPAKEDKCTVCRQTIDEVLDKLKDPDTELGIIETLLKACNAVRKYKKECKRMVFEFGPVFLVDAGKIIENLDICTRFHACNKHEAKTEEVLADGKIQMVTSS